LLNRVRGPHFVCYPARIVGREGRPCFAAAELAANAQIA
jgi:hypothetical protein